MNINVNDLKKITVMYVEDEDVIRTQTADIFKSVFKETFIAANGQEALNLFVENQNKIDIIISDINMPVMTGIEMAEYISKNLNSTTPIIFTTAYNSEEYLLKALELDIAKFITKPIKIKELITEIASFAETKETKELKVKTQTLANHTKRITQENTKLENDNKELTTLLDFKKTLIENFVCSFGMDKNGHITYVSNGFSKTFGYDENEIINETITKIAVEPSIVQKEILHVLKEKKLSTFVAKFKTKNHQEIQLETTIVPKYNDEGLVNSYEFYQIFIPCDA